jgi:hypothetical protein
LPNDALAYQYKPAGPGRPTPATGLVDEEAWDENDGDLASFEAALARAAKVR